MFIAAGLAFKLAAVPFHMWTPDVYEGAPTPVTAFLAAAPKVAAIGLTLRVLYEPFGDWATEWRQIAVFISVASMLLGAFAAIGQTNIKRLLAYSSIGHMGYALVGLAAGTAQGAQSVLIYMAIYVVMTIGTFGCVLLMRRNGEAVESIDDLAGLARTQPMLAAALAIFMFSLAGIRRSPASSPSCTCSWPRSMPDWSRSRSSACSRAWSAPSTMSGSSR